MKFLYTTVLVLLLSASFGYSQTKTSSEEQYDKKYQERIKKSHLHGVYIPEDLADAFIRLNKLIDKDSKKKFKEVSEAAAVKKLHFSLGRWMIYNWGFYEGSRLSHSIRQLGVFHPDDVARFIIITYHRYLNKEDLKVKELVAQFNEKQEKEKEARKSRGKVIHEEKRKRKD